MNTELDKLYLRSLPNREQSDADLAYNSVMRDKADPSLAELNLTVDPVEQQKDDAIGQISRLLNTRIEGYEPKADNTWVAPDAAGYKPSYLEDTILPEAANMVLNGFGLPLGINDVLQMVKDPFGQFQEPVPQVVASPEGIGIERYTPGQEVEALKGIATHGKDFVKGQPLTASLMTLGAISGSKSALSKMSRPKAHLPSDPKTFFKEAENVIKGDTRYAHVYLDSKAKGFGDARNQLKTLKEQADKAGLEVRVARSKNPDYPGINAAIYNPKAMREALEGTQSPIGAREFVGGILDRPGTSKMQYPKSIIEPLRKGNTVIVPEVNNPSSLYERIVNFGEKLRSPHRIMQNQHPEAAPIFSAATESVIGNRVNSEALMQVKNELYEPIRKTYGKEYFGQALADINRKVRNFKRGKPVEGEFDDPIAYRQSLVMQYPADVHSALNQHYNLMEHFKIKVARELEAQKVPDDIIGKMLDDDAYFTRMFQGNFQIFGKRGKNGKREFIDRAETMSDAISKMKDAYKRGFADVQYGYDNIIPGEIVARIPRKQYERILSAIESKTGADREMVQDWLKKEFSFTKGAEVPTLSTKETKKKSARNLQNREINPVTGEEFDFTQFDYDKVMDAYIQGMSRWMAVNQFERVFQAQKAKIPQSLSRLHSYLDDYRNDIWGRRYASSANFDAAVQKIAPWVKPMALERWLGGWMKFRSQIALGTPAAAAVNMYQTFQTLAPRVPMKVFAKAWKESFNDDVLERAKKAGVLGLPTKLEDIHLTNKGVESQRNLLYLHGKAEQKSRLVSFRAGELHAQTPEGRWVAEKLGMDINDPEFVKKYAVDMVQQTQFDMSKADMPMAFRGPIKRVLFQFKPFGAKFVESMAALRELPNPGAAYAKAAGAQLVGGGLRTLTNPVKFATTLGVLSTYKEIREWATDKFGEEEGEAIANGFIYGIPGAFGADVSQRMNIDLFPSFGRTPKESAVNYLTGPTVSDIFTAVEFMGLEKKDKDAVYSYLRRIFPQVGMGKTLWQAIKDDKYLRDNRGKKIGKADPVERFLEGLAFGTVKRRHANDLKFELRDPNMVQRGFGVSTDADVAQLRGKLQSYNQQE